MKSLDHFQYLSNCAIYPSPPLIQHKSWPVDCGCVRGGVGVQLIRYWKWSRLFTWTISMYDNTKLLLKLQDYNINKNSRNHYVWVIGWFYFISPFLEHCKNVLSDSWRLNQLDKSSVSPSHPYSKFGSGTWFWVDVDFLLKYVLKDWVTMLHIWLKNILFRWLP